MTTVLTLSCAVLQRFSLRSRSAFRRCDAVDEEPRGDAFFVAEVVIQAADAAAGRAHDVVDRRRFDALTDEAVERRLRGSTARRAGVVALGLWFAWPSSRILI